MRFYYIDYFDLLDWVKNQPTIAIPDLHNNKIDPTESQKFYEFRAKRERFFQENKNYETKLTWANFVERNRGLFETNYNGFVWEMDYKTWYKYNISYFINGHKLPITNLSHDYPEKSLVSVGKYVDPNGHSAVDRIFLGLVYLTFENGYKEYKIEFLDSQPIPNLNLVLNDKISNDDIRKICKLPKKESYGLLKVFHYFDYITYKAILIIQRWNKSKKINYKKMIQIQKAYVVKDWFDSPSNPVSNKLRENWFKLGILRDILG